MFIEEGHVHNLKCFDTKQYYSGGRFTLNKDRGSRNRGVPITKQ